MTAEAKFDPPENRPLLWSEGMLLTPQHFQQNDRYWGEQLTHLMGQLRPHYWGVISLEVDHARMSDGELAVTRLHGVTRDGLAVHHDTAAGDPELVVDLTQVPRYQQGHPVRIYLAVPGLDAGRGGDGRTSRRFAPAAGAEINDANTGGDPVEVLRLRPCLELWAGEVPPPRYSSMALCEVKPLAAGAPEFTAYQPPMLRLSASRAFGDQALEKRLRETIAAVRRKTRELCGRPNPEDTTVGIHPSYRKAILATAAALPPLEILVESGTAHPFDLYLALATQVGQLAAITANPLPRRPRPYDHDDLEPGFDDLLDTFDGVLKSIRVGYRLATFERPADGVFEYPLEAGWKLDELLLELRGRDGADEESLAQWLGNARIGSDSVQPLLLSHRLTGANVVRVNAAGTGRSLPVRDGSLLVKLVNTTLLHEGKQLDAIRPGSRLRIDGGGRGAPGSIVLYHLDAQGGDAAARG